MSRDRPSSTYLAEIFTPRAEMQRSEAERVHAAAAALAASGVSVRHLHSVFVPDEETAFHLFEAEAVSGVERALHDAGLDAERISPATSVAGERSREAPALASPSGSRSLPRR